MIFLSASFFPLAGCFSIHRVESVQHGLDRTCIRSSLPPHLLSQGGVHETCKQPHRTTTCHWWKLQGEAHSRFSSKQFMLFVIYRGAMIDPLCKATHLLGSPFVKTLIPQVFLEIDKWLICNQGLRYVQFVVTGPLNF